MRMNFGLALITLLAGASAALGQVPAGKTPYATLSTSKGSIVVRLLLDAAPNAVSNFVGLATGRKPWTDPKTGKTSSRPLYSGVLFHRVIPDFMIQTGDPLGDGTGGPGYEFADELSAAAYPMDRAGLVAMANAGPDTNGSQFFITVASTPWIAGQYSVFGEVVDGFDVAVAISLVGRDNADRPTQPVTLQGVKFAYDLDPASFRTPPPPPESVIAAEASSGSQPAADAHGCKADEEWQEANEEMPAMCMPKD